MCMPISCPEDPLIRNRLMDVSGTRDCECYFFIEGDASMVARETKEDSVLCKVLHFTQHSWPERPEPLFQPYHNKRGG